MPPLSAPARAGYTTDLSWRPAVAAGDEVPAFALVRVTGRDAAGVYTVAQPDTAGGPVWVNSPVLIEAAAEGGGGAVTPTGPVDALYESADGTPAVGETWGAGAGSWKLRKNKSGFVVVSAGDPDSGTCAVLPRASASGSGVTGSGTDNRVVRWDGTTALQDSGVTITDANVLTIIDPPTGTLVSQLSLTPASATGLAYPYLFLSLSVPIEGAAAARLYLSADEVGIATPNSRDFVLRHSETDTAGVSILSSYAVTRGTRASPVIHTGIDGTLAPGMTVTGGLITSSGSGSFVSTSAANTFTNSQLFQPASSAGVPVTAQGLSGQTGNLFEAKTDGGSVVASISAAGAITGAALNGPYDAGTW